MSGRRRAGPTPTSPTVVNATRPPQAPSPRRKARRRRPVRGSGRRRYRGRSPAAARQSSGSPAHVQFAPARQNPSSPDGRIRRDGRTWRSAGLRSIMPSNDVVDSALTYEPASPLLDAINRRLLTALGDDPRLSTAALARRVGMSAPAVAEWVRRLEEAGVIRGYSLELDPAALGLPLTAYVRVRPNPGYLAHVADLARSIPEVVECHRITGEDCFILKVHLPAMDQIDRV